ncbi:MAG: hypothetical protein JW760_08810, partial [Spirochaetales bacterium]|nr:hypothetical protein [Spirochaetales bacterium]
MKRGIFLFLFIFSCLILPAEEPLRLLSWNVESGGALSRVIAEQLTAFQQAHLVTLVEVDDADRDLYTKALGDQRISVLSRSGARYNDHILVIFDPRRLELLSTEELHEYRGTVITPSVDRGGKRSPLILRFRDLLTGVEFFYVSVHLERTNEAQRKLQSLVLREWILDQGTPVLAVGDFNFDYSFGEQPGGNDSFLIFTYDPRIDWIEPEVFVDTNYSERNGV